VYQKPTIYPNVHSSGLENFQRLWGESFRTVNVIFPGTSGNLKKIPPSIVFMTTDSTLLLDLTFFHHCAI